MAETTTAESGFQLQILHASDQEAGIPAFNDAPGLSAVLNALENQEEYENTIKLTSGDLFIAGPFFGASVDIYDSLSERSPTGGIADILIQNELGWDAAAIGNHEFDAGDATFLGLLAPESNWINGTEGGQGIGAGGYPGALFPYLANNLDFSAATIPAGLSVVENGNAPQSNTISGSVVVDVNGEPIGVLAAVTPYLKSIANTGNVVVTTGEGITSATPIADQVAVLIANLQPEVEALTAQGINKIILMTHLQEAEIEQALAQALVEQGIQVDVLIGGGSHRVMTDEGTIPPLREDETQQTNGQLLVPYPQLFTAGENTVYYVNTGANYRYLSQLIATFDENGRIVAIGEESGTYATDIAGVDRLYAEDITSIEEVKAVADPELVAIVEGVQGFVNQLDGQIFGQTDVFLNGIRGSVRTQETNLGNLAADSQDFYAEEYLNTHGDNLLAGFDEIDISLKNGGGIRDQIGLSFIPGGGGDLVQLPPSANPEVGKEEGDVSALDISNSLRFDNSLSVGKVTAAGLYEIFEHAVARVEAVGGQFAQVSGVRFSFDPTAPARTTTQAGERIQNLVVVNEDGTIKDIVVQDGELVGDPNRQFSIVTLEFLATGGDGYPLVFEELQSLSDFTEPGTLGQADLAAGGEQDALAEYLSAFFNEDNGQAAFGEEDTDQTGDTRIQNLAFREDTVLGEVVDGYFNFIQYAQFQLLDEGISLSVPTTEVNGIQLALLFDETYYLAENQDVAGAVQRGAFGSGFEHFLAFGLQERRDPSILFDEEYYLETYQDVADAVASDALSSGLVHYLNFGVFEPRDPSGVFSEADYLLTNPDVAAAVEQGAFTNGFDHYLEAGAAEGRGPNLLLFQENFYRSNNSDIAQAVGAGIFSSGLEHYIRFGQGEQRNPSSLFDESAYLTANTDVAEVVAGDLLSSGFEHYIKFGRAEGRDAIAVA